MMESDTFTLGEHRGPDHKVLQATSLASGKILPFCWLGRRARFIRPPSSFSATNNAPFPEVYAYLVSKLRKMISLKLFVCLRQKVATKKIEVALQHFVVVVDKLRLRVTKKYYLVIAVGSHINHSA